jgi:hypothetical protein
MALKGKIVEKSKADHSEEKTASELATFSVLICENLWAGKVLKQPERR